MSKSQQITDLLPSGLISIERSDVESSYLVRSHVGYKPTAYERRCLLCRPLTGSDIMAYRIATTLMTSSDLQCHSLTYSPIASLLNGISVQLCSS